MFQHPLAPAVCCGQSLHKFSPMNPMESKHAELESFHLHPLWAAHSDTSAVPSLPQSAVDVDFSDYQRKDFTRSVQLEGPGEEPGCCEVTESIRTSKVLSHPLTSVQLLCEVSASLSIRRRGRQSVLGVAPRKPQRPNEPIKVPCSASDRQRLLWMNGLMLMHQF